MDKDDGRPGGLPMNEAPAGLRHSVGIPDAVSVWLPPDPFGDLWAHLELAAKNVSDALTGGGVFAVHGAPVGNVLRNTSERNDRLVKSLCALNRILREMDKRRSRFEGEAAQAIEAGTGETEGLDPKDESAVHAPKPSGILTENAG